MKYVLSCTVFALVAFSNIANANNNQIKSLQSQIGLIQAQLSQLQVAPAAKIRSSGENTGNPSISVIANFTANKDQGHRGNFLPLSEGEFVFSANIDPHAKLNVTVTGAQGSMAIEEGFITSSLPYGINLKSGRKFLPVGRVNEAHPHTLVYADRPNALVNLFGSEIFIGDGLIVDRPWFVGDSIQTLTLGAFSTENNVAFDSTGAAQFASLARWTGMWDTSDFSTLELGWTYVKGKNGSPNQASTTINAAHLAWKFQSIDAFALNVESEWLQQNKGQGSKMDGAYLLLDTSFNRHWNMFGRYDYTKKNSAQEVALSAGLMWKISEFQNLTLQYKNTRNALAGVAGNLGINPGGSMNSWLFRWVVAIGPHGAHRY